MIAGILDVRILWRGRSGSRKDDIDTDVTRFEASSERGDLNVRRGVMLGTHFLYYNFGLYVY
jgi:hypothetical protein